MAMIHAFCQDDLGHRLQRLQSPRRCVMRRLAMAADTNKQRDSKLRPIAAGQLRSWTAIRDFLVETLPGCRQPSANGREAIRVAGKVLAYLACNERSRPVGLPDNEEFVIMRIDLDRREHLLELNPEAFFVTPHYQTYPGVIVRLSTVNQRQFGDLLVDAWRLLAPRRLVRDWDAKVS
jgi:hypothetical protein